MKRIVLSALFALSSTAALARDLDLTLPGERWVAEYTMNVCADGFTPVAQASHLDALSVRFGRFSTDMSLDNALLKATFSQDGATCAYSALLLADNSANTISLVESRAFAVNGDSDCLAGKDVIDTTLEHNSYRYLHGRLAIDVAAANAEAVCGAGSTTIGLHFQVRGRL